jgi:hypothetical protein
VAHVQASSFHLQAAVFDDLFFKLFKVPLKQSNSLYNVLCILHHVSPSGRLMGDEFWKYYM